MLRRYPYQLSFGNKRTTAFEWPSVYVKAEVIHVKIALYRHDNLHPLAHVADASLVPRHLFARFSCRRSSTCALVRTRCRP